MSIKEENKNNKIKAKLDLIILLLKDLVAIELRKKERTKQEIRDVLKMDNNRVILLLKERKKTKRKKEREDKKRQKKQYAQKEKSRKTKRK